MPFYYCPLEQFIILKFFGEGLFDFISITNTLITFLIIIFVIFVYTLGIKSQKDGLLFIVPNNWVLVFKPIFNAICLIVSQNLNFEGKAKYLPVIGTIFLLVLILNLYGMNPYTYTITSQPIITFSIGLFAFTGIQIISIKKNKLNFFSSFFPSGISVVLGILVIPIEFMSFLFKPLSLSVRLFINMFAGHVLLKVAASFAVSILSIFGVGILLHYTILLVLVALYFMEVAASIIQAAVFAGLLCVYLNEVFNTH